MASIVCTGSERWVQICYKMATEDTQCGREGKMLSERICRFEDKDPDNRADKRVEGSSELQLERMRGALCLPWLRAGVKGNRQKTTGEGAWSLVGLVIDVRSCHRCIGLTLYQLDRTVRSISQ